jgi:hypothetical protein
MVISSPSERASWLDSFNTYFPFLKPLQEAGSYYWQGRLISEEQIKAVKLAAIGRRILALKPNPEIEGALKNAIAPINKLQSTLLSQQQKSDLITDSITYQLEVANLIKENYLGCICPLSPKTGTLRANQFECCYEGYEGHLAAETALVKATNIATSTAANAAGAILDKAL